MKAIAALGFATGAVATFGWKDAPKFDCPKNPGDNPACPPDMNGGHYGFGDVPVGKFPPSFGGLNWNNWDCADGFGAGGRFSRRTGGGKVATGVCGSQKGSNPSFTVGKDVDRFSVGEIHLSVEFDCDLEFHYDMPDGSTCKHRNSCSSKGSVISNSQCGGAHGVTIHYPPQPNKPKPSCSIGVTSVSMSCGSSSTKPPGTKPTTPATKPTTTTTAVVTTTTTVDKPTTTLTTPPKETTTPPKETTTPPKETTTPPTETKPPTTLTTAVTTTTTPGKPSDSTTPPKDSTTPPKDSTTPPKDSTTSSVAPTTTTSPAGSPPVSPPGSSTTATTSEEDCDSSTTGVLPTSPTSPSAPTTGVITPTSSAPVPTETLPCPDVVPKCLNTWMFSLGCKDNTDSACFCPDELFVKNIYTCIYAHGETDTIVSDAVVYIQGLCAAYCGENPAVITGPTVTSYITPTATQTLPATYTTVTVIKTTVVPCTDDSGSVIPSSSTTVTINTSAVVPQVSLTEGPSGTVGVVPVPTITPAPVKAPSTPTPAPVGTGKLVPTSTPAIVGVNAGGRVTASFGVAGAVAIAAALLL